MSYQNAVTLSGAAQRATAAMGYLPALVSPVIRRTQREEGHLRALRDAYPGLAATLTRRLGDRALAEDLLQQAAMESLSKLAADRILDPQRIAGYVYRVALNLLRNHRRKIDSRVELRASSSALEELASEGSPASDFSRELLVHYVRSVVNMLPAQRDREVLRRFYLEEENKQDICEQMGMSALHFDKVVHRARQRLRTLIAAQGLEHGVCVGF